VGSLPRPADLVRLIRARKENESYDLDEFRATRSRAVRDAVSRQREVGLDIVNDGEMGRVGFSAYVFDRIGGFAPGPPAVFHIDDLDDFPEYRDAEWSELLGDLLVPYCTTAVTHTDIEPLRDEITDLRAAVGDTADPDCVFMNAAAPGQLAFNYPNQHYRDHEEYVFALADAMRPEYEAVVDAGFVLQLDAPDLAMQASVHMNDYRPEFAWYLDMAIEALNHAVQNIPAERMRLHLCWGNGAWTHHHDVELRTILPSVLRARPQVLSIEAANPRHAHEWRVFREIPLPDDKLLMPGVIDTTTTFIEHPDLVADRLETFAEIVGRERVIGATDCGLGTHAEYPPVHPDIAWAKLGSLTEGARRASERLF
jgi:5-methyltetrahydropteroyltriglutamate--homocysteine methyltransferase